MGYLSPDPHWNANDHCGYGDSSNKRDSNRRPNKCPQLPQDLLLPTPWLLSPESAARGTEPKTQNGPLCTAYIVTNIAIVNIQIFEWGYLHFFSY